MTVYKHSAIYFLKILILVFLLLFPINASADSNINMQDLNNWPPVIQNLELMHAKDPYNKQIIDSLANAYNNYGTLLAQNKRWNEAESNLNKSVKLNSSSRTKIAINLSNIYVAHAMELYNAPDTSYNSYQHLESKQLVMQALSFNQNNASAYILLGDIEYMNQQMPAALEAWKRAAQLLPDNAQVKQRLAKIQREANTETAMHEKYNAFFLIKIDPDLAYLPNFDINDSLNNARIAVATDFQFNQQQKIPVVVYTLDQYQQTLTDAPEWSEGAYDGKLRIIIPKNNINPKQINTTIVHEYTHAVIGNLTNNLCPRWLNEGLAKYEEFKHGVPPNISYLALAYNNNLLIPWSEIDQHFLSTNKQEVLLAYQQSFSFVYYLVQKYGMTRMVSLLKTIGTGISFNKAFEQNYGLPLDVLQKSWQLWLNDFIPHWAEAPATSNYGY